MSEFKYDRTDKIDILHYAEKLKGQTFREVLKAHCEPSKLEEEAASYGARKRKGGLGNLLEVHYFDLKLNSKARPDFEEADLELKVFPYEITKKGKKRAGERMVLTMIPNQGDVSACFEESHLFEKIAYILMIAYLRDRDKENLDYSIDYVQLFSILSEACREDYEIIRQDFEDIMQLVRDGRAHELSEGMTRYLGACTKGASAKESTKPQAVGNIEAKRRAFSFKQPYMTFILNQYLTRGIKTYDTILKNRVVNSFEDYVLQKINTYIGRTQESLIHEFNLMDSRQSKQITSMIVMRMLGIKTNQAEEFIKAGIIVKTIRVEENNSIREHMSFPTFEIAELLKEDFYESTLYDLFESTKFLFAVYQKQGEDYIFRGAKFWNMPVSDLEGVVKNEWLRVHGTLQDGVVFKIHRNSNGVISKITNNLPRASETKVIHVRPHASKSYHEIDGIPYGNGSISDSDILPNGDRMTKQCFWLNKAYIYKQIRDLLERNK